VAGEEIKYVAGHYGCYRNRVLAGWLRMGFPVFGYLGGNRVFWFGAIPREIE